MLEKIIQGNIEWVYGMILQAWEYFSGALVDVLSVDFAYLEARIPILLILRQSMVAVGWALLIGNLVFQATKSMMAGLGFEGEDPKLLFTRTFVFSFLLVASPQICDICLNMTSTIIGIMDMPNVVSISLVDATAFDGLPCAWLVAIVCGVIVMFQSFKLIFALVERYFILAVLTICAPLAFGVGGSKNTSDIFSGWCRMYGSMCLLMILNVVFVKIILSVLASAPSGVEVLLWVVLVISIVKVARKADDIITRMGLNPAITGNQGRGLGTMLAYAVARTALQQVVKTMGAAKPRGPAPSRGPVPPPVNPKQKGLPYISAVPGSPSGQPGATGTPPAVQERSSTSTHTQTGGAGEATPSAGTQGRQTASREQRTSYRSESGEVRHTSSTRSSERREGYHSSAASGPRQRPAGSTPAPKPSGASTTKNTTTTHTSQGSERTVIPLSGQIQAPHGRQQGSTPGGGRTTPGRTTSQAPEDVIRPGTAGTQAHPTGDTMAGTARPGIGTAGKSAAPNAEKGRKAPPHSDLGQGAPRTDQIGGASRASASPGTAGRERSTSGTRFSRVTQRTSRTAQQDSVLRQREQSASTTETRTDRGTIRKESTAVSTPGTPAKAAESQPREATRSTQRQSAPTTGKATVQTSTAIPLPAKAPQPGTAETEPRSSARTTKAEVRHSRNGTPQLSQSAVPSKQLPSARQERQPTPPGIPSRTGRQRSSGTAGTAAKKPPATQPGTTAIKEPRPAGKPLKGKTAPTSPGKPAMNPGRKTARKNTSSGGERRGRE